MSKQEQEFSKAAWDEIYANYSASQDAATYGTCNYCTFQSNYKHLMTAHILGNHRVLLQCEDCKVCLEPSTYELHRSLKCDNKAVAELV